MDNNTHIPAIMIDLESKHIPKNTYDLYFTKYALNQSTALTLDFEGGRVATLTTCIPECLLEKDEVLIKNWGENEGVLKALIKDGIIRDTGDIFTIGHVKANICKLHLRRCQLREMRDNK